jgi:hypothetical protein
VRAVRALRAALVAVLLVVALAAASPVGAQTGEPAVTVASGPTTRQSFAPPCNDVVLEFEAATSFVLSRTGATTSPLTLTYEATASASFPGPGAAEPGVHFDPLPGTATFAAGQSSTTVTVTPRALDRPVQVEMVLTVVDGAGYSPGSPGTATIRFATPRTGVALECGYQFTDDPWNRSQTVAVGESLHALTLEQFTPPALTPAPGRFRVVSGTLPAGVTLREDGSFAGAPTSPGTTTATIEACRPAPPGTCVTTTLTVTVTGTDTTVAPPTTVGPATTVAGLRFLAVTGSSSTAQTVVAVAAGVLLAGLVLALLAAPYRVPARRQP